MSQATIIFSHANSFPASTYEVLFEAWRAAGYQVHAIEKYGHDPRYPVTTDWPHLVRQLKDFIQQKTDAPVYLVGHSLGGYLSMMLASRHPELTRGVIVLDSPLLHGWRAWGLGLARALGAVDRVMPSGIAAQRCYEWPSIEAVRAHFQSKPKFAAFQPRILDAYVQHGTETHVSIARRLSFKREVEAKIYKSMPLNTLKELYKNPPQCPMAFVGGTQSKELKAVKLSGIRRIMGPNMSWIEGSHLYPFERPQDTIKEVLTWLNRFEVEPDAPNRPR